MLIIAMSFSGSMVFLAIVICSFICKKYLSSNWTFGMLKLNLIFYCLPLPLFKHIYGDALYSIFNLSFLQRNLISPLSNIIQIERKGSISLDWKLYIFLVWVIWIVGMLLAYKKQLNHYNNLKMVEKKIIDNNDYFEILEKIKKELGIKKKVTLICASDAKKICTMGIFEKYILIPEKGIESNNLYYIFKHELIHIKREDVLFKYITIFVLLIHWFNPLMYFYFYMESIYCEQSCDSLVVYKLNKDERKKYGELIINMALNKENSKYKYYFSSSKKIIEGRLKNMFNIKKMKRSVRICSFIIGGMIMFFGSLTVFAYEEPKVISWQTELKEGNLKSKQVERDFVTDMDSQLSDKEVLVIREFIGEDGSNYNLPSAQKINNERFFCAHSFVSGYYKEHFLYYDNSCRTNYYNADRCEKCGDIVVKSYSHTETSTKCTH